jgi:hypothetical protein
VVTVSGVVFAGLAAIFAALERTSEMAELHAGQPQLSPPTSTRTRRS